MPKKSIYFTTPIYYPNDAPHLGTAYTTVAADISTRWARLSGKDAFFLTGLDEHGKKIESAAIKKGLSPQELVDSQAKVFKETFKLLDIDYSRFIRTTDEDHIKTVQEFLERVYSAGDIYKGVYQGLYCVDCETYYTEKELLEGLCPIHRRPVEMLSENCYYFKLSKYRNQLLDYYEKNPEFIQPKARFNEVISFVSEGLEDLNISRTSFSWGIPLPFDKEHVAYVWFDALINYITGIGFLDQPDQFKQYWSNSTHLIGKDILRFHAIIWIAMLKSAGIDFPKKIFAHGFWTINGMKFSKSLGNAISPVYLIQKYGLDPLRYYMFRAFPFGNDGNFSEADLVQRNNSELSQGLGNLVQRTTAMLKKYNQNIIPSTVNIGKPEQEIMDTAASTVKRVSQAMDDFAFYQALDLIWGFTTRLNVYINEKEPWNLAKRNEVESLDTTLATLVEGIRFITSLTSPFMPESSLTIAQRLGASKIPALSELSWGRSLTGKIIKHDEPLFPILEMVSDNKNE